MSVFVLKLIAGVVANVAIFGVPLFLLAGTWGWWRAWVLLGVVLLGSAGSVIGLPRSLLEERLKPPLQAGQPWADKVVLILLIVMFMALIVIIPADVFRFHLISRPREFVSALGLVLFISGWYIAYQALKQNSFATTVVRHQEERQQVVIDTGLYGVVRHPMYSGGVLLMIGMPLWLESCAATLFALVPIAILAARIAIEERLLIRELKGYQEYTAKIRNRLIPFVW
jgi:protein-S-isoprenylcysteine O-methyltransferase Ste14